MRSLVSYVEFLWLISRYTLLLFVSPVSAFAGGSMDAAGSFLEEPRIVAINDREGEIQINFSTDVRYVRHFPEERGDTLRIFLEVADPCAAEAMITQESRWPSPADWFVPFTVTFPEIIKRSGTGTSACQVTHHQVDVSGAVLIKFRKIVNFSVKRGNDNHSLIIAVPLLKHPGHKQSVANADLVAPAAKQEPKAPRTSPPPASVPTLLPMPTDAAPQDPKQEVPQSQQMAKVDEPATPQVPPAELMQAGRTALAGGDAIKAILMFNQLLNLPPNDYSQEAQELIGQSREKAGEIAKARVEYQLYLKLYPEGEGSERVKQRLAALEAIKEAPKQETAKAKSKKPVREVHQNTFAGSISQYYYSGMSQNETRNSAGEKTRTRTNEQSSLITNLDATARFRHNELDTKVVFRDTQSHNFFAELADKNTVSSAYLEHTNKADDYMFRIGRQSGTSQGVLGRFDGAFGRYGLNPQWHVTAVLGKPDDGSHNSVKTARHFYGAAVEFGPLAEKWTGSVYAIQQVADDMVERRAIGTEMRYFNGTTSWFGLLDYDTIYDMVNIAMVQGNWVAFDGYNFNLLLDHRKSPILYGETAIQGKTGALSVGDLRTTLSDSDIHDYVRGLVPDSDMAMLGVTKQVTERWQLGGDVRLNRTYSTDGAGVVPSQPGSGNIYTYTAQAIGTNTLFNGDVSVIMMSYVNDPVYNAKNLSFSNSLTLREKWRLDTSLRYYYEKRNTDARTWKVTPSVRLNYHWRDNMSFEAEMTIDRTHTDDPVAATITDNWRETLFAGYRWDFR